MNIITTQIKDVVIIEPDIFEDNRGFFAETYNQKRYEQYGIKCIFVQDNLSFSVKGTLRGLHFQKKHAQAKLVQVITGEIFDVAVDIRSDSSTFGKWVGVHLSEENKRQLFIPEGFAHGFCVISKTAHFLYKCSDLYSQHDERGIIWSDPDLGIDWPVNAPIVSEKDKLLPRFSEIRLQPES